MDEPSKVDHYQKSVAEAVQKLSTDPTFTVRMSARLQSRKMINTLVALREKAGMTQQQVAERMGSTQGWVSKMESKYDDALRLTDVYKYARAVGYVIRFSLDEAKTT